MLMHKDVTTVRKDIVEDILDKLTDDLAKEIDFNVLLESLISCGWSTVELPPFDSRYKTSDVLDWVYHHCDGEFENLGVRFIFEDKKDATLFALKWL
jgi:hypothetical protein